MTRRRSASSSSELRRLGDLSPRHRSGGRAAAQNVSLTLHESRPTRPAKAQPARGHLPVGYIVIMHRPRFHVLAAPVLALMLAGALLSASAGRAAAAPPGTPTATTFDGTPTVGPLFASAASPHHFCTASVVHSPRGDVLLTAAHCTAGTAAGDTFAPGFYARRRALRALDGDRRVPRSGLVDGPGSPAGLRLPHRGAQNASTDAGPRSNRSPAQISWGCKRAGASG